jgi:hypothetical protein
MCNYCLTFYDLNGSGSQALSKTPLVVVLVLIADAEQVICLWSLRLEALRMQGMPATQEVSLLYSQKAVHVDRCNHGGSGGSHRS